MKKVISVILTLVLLLTMAACGNSQKDVYEQNAEQTDAGAGTEDGKETEDKDTDGKSGAEDGEAGDGKGQGAEQKELSGELTITALFEYPLKLIADEFMALHPGVTVKVEAEDIMNLDLYGYSKRLIVELMSGAMEADIMEAAWVDYCKAGQNGLLCDLYEYMDAAPDFRREDYFENVFEALETDGSLYAAPYAFALQGVFLNKPVTDALGVDVDSYKTINYEQILDLYEEADAKGLLAEDFYLDASGQSHVPWSNEMSAYYDYQNRTANFDSPEALRLVERAKSLRTPEDRGIGYQPPPSHSGVYLPEVENCFSVKGSVDVKKMELLKMESEVWNHFIPLATTNGQVKMDGFVYAIPTASDQKELAWEFLKYWMGERDDMKSGDPFSGYTPINRANCRKFVESQFSPNPVDEELYERYIAIAESVNYTAPANVDLTVDLFDAPLKDFFYRDLMTAEDYLKQLQERTEMYLKE